MTTKHEVIALYNAEPELTVRQAAMRLGCLPAYITATSKRNGFRFARVHHTRSDEELKAIAAMQKSYSSLGYCILNAFGDVWTPEWFLTEHIANRYIAKMKRKNPTWDLSKHTVVPARHVVYPKRTAPTQETDT